jgi:alpha-beta hydrolase superfamily lysophospholipase
VLAFKQARARAFTELGDSNSRFMQLSGIQVHAQTAVAPELTRTAGRQQLLATPGSSRPILAVHCYHGFGANLYSYTRVQQALASATGGMVTTHDMPGFGLTERCVCGVWEEVCPAIP